MGFSLSLFIFSFFNQYCLTIAGLSKSKVYSNYRDIHTSILGVGYWQLFSFWSIFDIGLLRVGVHPMAILFILILPLAHIEHRIYRIIAFFFLWPYFAFYQFDFLEIYFSTSSGFAVAAAIFMRWKLFKTSETQSFWNQFLSPAENTIPYHFKF